MYIASETLSISTLLLTSVFAIGAFFWASFQSRKELEAQQIVSFLGLAGFILFAQLIYLQLGSGMTGHFIGAALVAVLFGPWSACFLSGVVLGIHYALFEELSYQALGANYLVFGCMGAWSSFFIYRFFQGRRSIQGDLAQIFAVGLAAHGSLIVVSLVLVLIAEAFSGKLVYVYSLFGFYEGIITATVFAMCAWSVRKAHPSAMPAISIKPVLTACLAALVVLPFSAERIHGLDTILQQVGSLLQ